MLNSPKADPSSRLSWCSLCRNRMVSKSASQSPCSSSLPAYLIQLPPLDLLCSSHHHRKTFSFSVCENAVSSQPPKARLYSVFLQIFQGQIFTAFRIKYNLSMPQKGFHYLVPIFLYLLPPCSFLELLFIILYLVNFCTHFKGGSESLLWKHLDVATQCSCRVP